MKRREVLLGFAGLASGALLAEALIASPSIESGVETVVLKRLHYLKLDRAGVRRFAHDYADRHLTSPPKLFALSATAPIYTRVPQPWINRLAPSIPYGEERIVTTYLLSSDFFPQADEQAVVHYLEFFDAQVRGSPFARLRVPSA